MSEGGGRVRGRPKRTTYVDERTWTAFGEFKAGIIGRKGEGAVSRALAALGAPALHDVLLADLTGLTQVDHLVRARGAILVIETKTYGGHIAGAVDGLEWVQHLSADEVRHSFQNPTRQNHRHCRAVEDVVDGLDVPVIGCVVFAGSATFSEELKGVVVPIGHLATVLQAEPHRVCEAGHLEQAWHRLCAAAVATESRREEHQEAMRRRHG